MTATVYTLAMWKLKPGMEAEFVEAWRVLGETFRRLPNPPIGKGILVQSLIDPTLHYSFGPWANAEHIKAMRQDPGAQESISRLTSFCSESMPGGYRVIAEG